MELWNELNDTSLEFGLVRLLSGGQVADGASRLQTHRIGQARVRAVERVVRANSGRILLNAIDVRHGLRSLLLTESIRAGVDGHAAVVARQRGVRSRIGHGQRLGRDLLQVGDVGGVGRGAARLRRRLAHGGLRAGRPGRLGQLGMADVLGTGGRLDHLEPEAALLGLVLDDGGGAREALADDAHVVHPEDEVVRAQAGHLTRRVRLHAGDHVRAAFARSDREPEAVVVRTADQADHARAWHNIWKKENF